MTTAVSPTRTRAVSARTLGALAVAGVVIAFSLSSTLVKRAESPGVLVAFWRLTVVTSSGTSTCGAPAGGSRCGMCARRSSLASSSA